MWDKKILEINSKTVRVEITSNGNILSFKEWCQLIISSSEFGLFFTDILRSSHFEAFFWEVKPTNRDSWDHPFEFVLVHSVQLPQISTDSSAFKEFLREDQQVVSFPNLRGDAQLIVPNKINENDAYGHLAYFIRKAPADQVVQFWQKVCSEYQERISEKPIWLSTAGLGVPWLHVRIDSAPKYYRHTPYKNY